VYACDRFISDNVTLGEHIVFERFLPSSHVIHASGATAMPGPHDLERSHYNRVWALSKQIAMPFWRRPRNDNKEGSRQ